MNPKHSSANSNWYTPRDIIERARATLGRIDLDPASDAFGNSRVKAKRFHGNHGANGMTNGLCLDWGDGPNTSVFLNPPGGGRGEGGLPFRFWDKMIHEIMARRVSHAIFIAFNLDHIRTFQCAYHRCPCDYPMCIPMNRIAFEDSNGVPGKNPTRSNAIVYASGSVNRTDLFIKNFSDLGSIVVPVEYRCAELTKEDPPEEMVYWRVSNS